MRPPVKMLNLEDGLIDISTTPITLSSEVGGALVDTTVGTITITLPPLASVRNGKPLYFARVNGANNVVLDGDGSETINGVSTFSITVDAGYVLVARTGGAFAGWWVAGEYLF